MSNDSDTDYYRMRERQARELAAVAPDPHVKRVHLDMAEHYAKLLQGPQAATPESTRAK